ncbi:oligosaccharide flippase family protein [Roseibium sp.]|uniref:oligosaccharide flippase family protein n=1 Tax=Roseibium sp. TaxID=1936156 RepID=UPI003A96B437
MAKFKLKGPAFWSVLLQFSRFGGNALVFFAIARFLTIEQIGAFGMAYAPIRWLQVLHKAGVSNCVVVAMRGNSVGSARDQEEVFSALFWLSMGITVIASMVLVGIAAVLQIFSENSQGVTWMIYAMIPVLIAFGLSSVPEGIMQKKLQIKALAIRTLFVQAVAAMITFMLAMKGYGGWALVGFTVLNAVASSVISIIAARWLPKGRPRWPHIREQLPQMSSISGRALLASSTRPMMQFAIGLVIGFEASGAFQIAQRVYQILDALCLAPIRFLILPLFSREVDRKGALSATTVIRALQMAGIISAPFYLGTMIISRPTLTWIIGPENAAHSVLPLQLLCLLGLNITSVTILTQAATVIGHSKVTFWRALWTLCGTAILGLPSLFISTEAVVLSFVAASYANLIYYYTCLGPAFNRAPKDLVLPVAYPYLAGLLALVPLTGIHLFWSPQSSAFRWVYMGGILTALSLYAVLLKLLVPAAWREFVEHMR